MAYYLGGSKELIESLPPEYQKAVWQAADHVVDVANEFALNYVTNIGITRVEEVGANITRPDPKPFLKALSPILETYRDTIGDDVLKWIEARR